LCLLDLSSYHEILYKALVDADANDDRSPYANTTIPILYLFFPALPSASHKGLDFTVKIFFNSPPSSTQRSEDVFGGSLLFLTVDQRT
jgi:hypothetical protein